MLLCMGRPSHGLPLLTRHPAAAGSLPDDLPEQVVPRAARGHRQGDVTAGLIPADQQLRARVITREAAVVCGSAWVDETFRQLDPAVHVHWQVRDGGAVAAGPCCARCRPGAPDPDRRTHGAQLPADCCPAPRPPRALCRGRGRHRLPDTRHAQDPAGLRTAQKYAVRCGGGSNHRIGPVRPGPDQGKPHRGGRLDHGRGRRARRLSPGCAWKWRPRISCRCDEALTAGADIIMLDDFSLEDMRAAVARNRAHGGPRNSKLRAASACSRSATLRPPASTSSRSAR